jgi:hypothetical protein
MPQYNVTKSRIPQYHVTTSRMSLYYATTFRISQYNVTTLHPAVSVAIDKVSDTRNVGGEDVSIEAVPYQVRAYITS